MDEKLEEVTQTINELVSTNDVLSLDTIKTDNFTEKYGNLKTLINNLEEIKKNYDNVIKEIIKANYFATGESSIKSNNGTLYIYKPESTRENFKKEELKAEYPEIYKKYVSVGKVAESLTVKSPKKQEEVK